MTVRELLARIDSRELTEWAAYYELEPWGTEVEDYRIASVQAMMANINRDPKKKSTPFTPDDFMPKREQPEIEEQAWEEQADILAAWAKVWDSNFGDSK